jgi:hypothetical protein
MKKYILLLLSLLIIIPLASCDTSSIENDYHDFKLSYDNQNHYDICECGKKENEEAHIFSDEVTVIAAPTCTTEGIEEYHCIVCGYKEQRATAPLGHTFDDWQEAVSATCISKGQLKRVCSKCGQEEFQETDYAAHTPVADDTLEATCSHEGHTGGTHCKVCNQELTEPTTIEKKNHNYGPWTTTIEATCTHKGQEKRTCQDCNYEEYREVAIKSHTIVPNLEVEATCTKTGLTGGTHCEVCNLEITPSTVVPMKVHYYDAWSTSIEATCTHKGQEVRVCSDCGHEEYRDVAIKSHTIVPNEEVSPSCNHSGLTGGTHCKDCNLEITPSIVVDKTDHDYGAWTNTQDSTCISEGQAKRVCNICGHEEYKTLDMIPHTPIPGTPEASTCITHGHTEGSYSSFCHKELEAPEELPLGSHNYSIETIIRQPNYNEAGIKEITCSVCGDSYQEPISRLSLTKSMWEDSFTSDYIKDKYIEIEYMDIQNNISYSIKLSNKNNTYYCYLYDYANGKEYEYYYDGDEVIETAFEGYKHRLYDSNNDPYNAYKNMLINAILNTSSIYNTLAYDTDYSYYKVEEVSTKNYKGNNETARVAISFTNDELLTMFAYSTSTYMINIQTVREETDIHVPSATHHHIVDGKCQVCNEEYYTYTTQKDNFNLYYYVNKNNKSVEFDYSLINSTGENVQFLMPTYYEEGSIKRFNTLYYEPDSYYYSKTVKSYTVNSNKLLKISYKDYSTERLLLLSDGTIAIATSDTDHSANPYNGDVIGKTFDLIQKDKTIRYYIKSSTEIIITVYKEINFYIMNGKQFTSFNTRTMSKALGHYIPSDSGQGLKHTGSYGDICFELDTNFKLTIDYDYTENSAFSAITFQRIEGYYSEAGKEYTIYFRGDNVDYKLYYDGKKIEITKA